MRLTAASISSRGMRWPSGTRANLRSGAGGGDGGKPEILDHTSAGRIPSVGQNQRRGAVVQARNRSAFCDWSSATPGQLRHELDGAAGIVLLAPSAVGRIVREALGRRVGWYGSCRWKGSGSTESEKAVLASLSFDQPSTRSRKSRFHPGGRSRETTRIDTGRAARRPNP